MRSSNVPFRDVAQRSLAISISKDICARTTMKSPSNASGQGAARASHDSMIASDMNNYTPTIAHSYAMVAGSHLHGLTPSIVICALKVVPAV